MYEAPTRPEHRCVLCRTLEVLKYLREKNPRAQIVALAVIPRGWTDAWHVYDWPSMYKRGIDVINNALKDYAAPDDAVHYLDCGPAVTPGGQVIVPIAWSQEAVLCEAKHETTLLWQRQNPMPSSQPEATMLCVAGASFSYAASGL